MNVPAASSVAMRNSSSSRPGWQQPEPGPARPTCSACCGCTDLAGIGKSSLLEAYARAARRAGFAVGHADGGGMSLSPAGIWAAAGDKLADVIIIDAADRLGAAEDWLRDEFLPALPAKTVVATASSSPPAPHGLP